MSQSRRIAIVAGIFVVLQIVLALAAPLVAPYDPLAQDIVARMRGPSLAHWLGTDHLGRDILSRILYGYRTALIACGIAVGLALLIGGSLGLLAAFYRGWWDRIIMRAMDILFAFPVMLLAIGIIAMLGPRTESAAIAIAVVYVPIFARLIRGPAMVLVEKAGLKKGQKVFIQAGSGGVGTLAIQLAKHLGATVATTTGPTNVALVKRLGADVAIDYKTQDFEDVLRDYDVVLNSQDGKTLEKSLRVLRRGGKLITISGPPDPEFGKQIGAPGFVKLVMRLLSAGVRRRARSRGVDFSFLFMKANGSQLREITRLIEAGAIRPVMDRVFPFDATNEALAYVEAGRAKGKVVVKLK